MVTKKRGIMFVRFDPTCKREHRLCRTLKKELHVLVENVETEQKLQLAREALPSLVPHLYSAWWCTWVYLPHMCRQNLMQCLLDVHTQAVAPRASGLRTTHGGALGRRLRPFTTPQMIRNNKRKKNDHEVFRGQIAASLKTHSSRTLSSSLHQTSQRQNRNRKQDDEQKFNVNKWQFYPNEPDWSQQLILEAAWWICRCNIAKWKWKELQRFNEG